MSRLVARACTLARRPVRPSDRRCPLIDAGFIPLEGAKLDDVFPSGSNEDVWRRAIKAAKPKNTVEDIEASIVQHVQSTLSRSACVLGRCNSP